MYCKAGKACHEPFILIEDKGNDGVKHGTRRFQSFFIFAEVTAVTWWAAAVTLMHFEWLKCSTWTLMKFFHFEMKLWCYIRLGNSCNCCLLVWMPVHIDMNCLHYVIRIYYIISALIIHICPRPWTWADMDDFGQIFRSIWKKPCNNLFIPHFSLLAKIIKIKN